MLIDVMKDFGSGDMIGRKMVYYDENVKDDVDDRDDFLVAVVMSKVVGGFICA